MTSNGVVPGIQCFSSPERPHGMEPWRELNGTVFTQWDRWFLALVAAERNGWAAVTKALEAQRGRPGGEDDAEGKLALRQNLWAPHLA